MTVKIEIKGIETTRKYLEMKKKGIQIGNNKGINKASFFMQGEVKQSIAGRRSEPTSVDTGRFLNSIDIVTFNNKGIIFTDLDYPIHLEYGTSKIRARRHFNNSKDRNKNKVKDIIKNEINSSI
mgnify:CR=1 FL=1